MNGLLALVNVFLRLLCQCINWVHRRVVLVGRRLKFVIVHGTRILLAGIWTLGKAAVHCLRPVGAYAAAVGGAIATLHLAGSYTRYLVDGPLWGLAAGAAWSALGLVFCVVAVERLASVSSREVVRAAARAGTNAGPDVALLVVLAGWVVGLPGTLGYGPIRVGWVTGVGTLVLIALMVPEWARERRTGPTDGHGPGDARRAGVPG